MGRSVKLNSIPINIWPEYRADDVVMWTDMFVEDRQLTLKEKREVLSIVQERMEGPGTIFWGVTCQPSGSCLLLKNLTHEKRLKLIEWLNFSHLRWDNRDLLFYSES